MSKVNSITVSCSLSMFFFCGGLLLKYTKGIERKGIKSFINGKVLRLLVPYIVLSTLFFFPKQILSHESISFYSYSEMIFAPRLNALGHFWFIPVLFNLYFIFALLYKIKLLNNKSFFIILLLCFVFFHFKPIDCKWLGIADVCQYSLFFALGYTLSNWILTNKEKILNYISLVIFFVLSVPACYCVLNGKLSHYLTLIGFTVLPLFFIFCYIIRKEYNNKFFRFFDGKYYTIYLLHWIIEYPAIMITDNILHLGIWARIIVFLSGLLIPVLIVNILNKFNIKNRFVKLVLGM